MKFVFLPQWYGTRHKQQEENWKINKMCKLGTDSQPSLKFTFKLLLKQHTFVDEQINIVNIILRHRPF